MYLGRNPVVGTQKILDSLESQFNGTLTTFDLRYGGVPTYPTLSESLIVSLGGVLQEPGEAYYVSSDKIVFSEAPLAGTECWILLYSQYGAAASSTPSLAIQTTGEPMGFENRTHSSISFDNATRTFSITPNTTGGYSSYVVWTKGTRRIVSTTQSVQVGTSTGLYYIYFDAFGDLKYKTTYFTWDTETMVAYVYWNSGTSSAPFIADERHGVVLDWQTHEYLHRTRGAVIAEGFSISAYTTTGNGSADAHAQFDLGNGTFFDEDLEVNITHSATPTTGTFTQVLTGGAEIPVFYISGSSGAWVRDSANKYACKQSATTLQYNLLSGSTWSTTPADNNRYVVSWIAATNDINAPVICILGQSQYTDIGSAEAVKFGSLTLTNFPIVEFRPLWKVIFQTSTGFTNTPNALIANVLDLRQLSETGEAGTLVSDHGLLTGLADDDHSQYLHTTFTRAGITANISTTGNLGGANLTLTGELRGPSTLVIDPATVGDDTGLVRIKGDLEVLGATTNINSTTLVIEDKNIILGDTSSPTDLLADGGGITLKGTTDKTFAWLDATDAWTSSERISIPLGSAEAPSLTLTGDPNTGLYSPGADQVAISTGGSGRLFVDASGRILAGVSNTSATATAVLQGNSFDSTAASLLFMSRGQLPSTAAAGLGLIRFGDNSQNIGAQIQAIAEAAWTAGASYPSALAFWTVPSGSTGITERLRITSAGNVGIGTTNPDRALYVNGQARIGGGTDYGTTEVLSVAPGTINFDATGVSGGRFKITSTGLVGINDSSPDLRLSISETGADITSGQAIFGTNMKGIHIENSLNDNSSVGLWMSTTSHRAGISMQRSDSANTWGTDLRFYTHDDSTTNLAYAYERLRIGPNGNVGIGITNPQTKLGVYSGSDDDGLTLEVGRTPVGGEGPALTFRHNTNNGTSQVFARIKSRMRSGNDASWSSDLSFYTGGNALTENFTIKPDGNVGINTTNPSEKLQVVGNIQNSRSFIGPITSKESDNICKLQISNGTSAIHNVTEGQDVAIRFGSGYLWNVNANSSYNGLRIGTNFNPFVGKVSSYLPAWEIDIGGRSAADTGSDTFVIRRNDTSWSNLFTVKGTGNVGIGTDSPVEKLELRGAADTNPTMLFHHAGIASYKIGVHGAVLKIAAMENGFGGHNGSFTSNNSQVISLSNTGNVGIGLTNPAYKLEVSGRSNFNDNIKITPTSESWAEGLQFYMPNTSTWGGVRWVRNRTNFHGSWYQGWTALDSSNDMVFGHNASGTQIDNILRLYGSASGSARIGRDLYITGLTGGSYGNRLVVGATDTSYTLQDSNLRPTIQAHGAYPVLSLNHTITGNTSHGPTIQFTCNGTGHQFVIGTTGNGTRLDIGFSAAGDWNPHNGIAGYNGTTSMSFTTSGNVGIGTLSPAYKLEVNGSFAATTKSFIIPHPTKEGYKLRHGSLEGPENGVYVRGKGDSATIELPEYWTGLVDPDSITVNLTPIGQNSPLWVERIEDNKVYVGREDTSVSYFYTIFAERIDVPALNVEIKIEEEDE